MEHSDPLWWIEPKFEETEEECEARLRRISEELKAKIMRGEYKPGYKPKPSYHLVDDDYGWRMALRDMLYHRPMPIDYWHRPVEKTEPDHSVIEVKTLADIKEYLTSPPASMPEGYIIIDEFVGPASPELGFHIEAKIQVPERPRHKGSDKPWLKFNQQPKHPKRR